MVNVQTLHAPPRPSRLPGDATPPPTASERRAPRQLAVTIVAPVASEQLPQVMRTLDEIGRDPAGNAVLPFAALPRTHFARLLVLEGTRDLPGDPIDPQLIYMTDVDEPLDVDAPLEHCLGELVDVAADGLDRIFGACLGYPTDGHVTRDRRLAFVREHLADAAATYVNTVGRSVQQIRQEAALRDAIEAFLDEAGVDWNRREPGEVRAAIQEFVATQETLAWARTPPPAPRVWDRVADTAHLLGVPLGVLALSPLLVPALPLWVLLLRLRERRDEPDTTKPTAEHVQQLAMLEDHAVQNQFSAVGFIKPGLLRQLTTEVVTRGIDYASRHVYRRANLAGVKTIHFARWVFLDDRRRMIFASNYDGSLEGYNDDFIHLVAWGLNAVFSNGVGYPRTRWLVFGGATQEEAFKNYLRRHQVPTQVWYSAYPDLTALNIDNNAHIRAGLYGEMSTDEMERWLRRI